MLDRAHMLPRIRYPTSDPSEATPYMDSTWVLRSTEVGNREDLGRKAPYLMHNHAILIGDKEMCSHVFGSSQGSPKIALLLLLFLFFSLYRTFCSRIVIYSLLLPEYYIKR